MAHSYPDPALTTAFDGVQPALPAGVEVAVRPSVVDQLVVSNPTGTPLEVLGLGGEPYVRVSSSGVAANLASPDWYTTSTPEGGRVPPDVLRDKGKGPTRWARVSKQTAWAVFDSRLRPTVDVPPAIRQAGLDRILTGWSIPLRYGSSALLATGHIVFRPVLGGLVVAVTRAPVLVNALQGGLPGLFLKAPVNQDVVVEGSDALPFLRFSHGTVSANTASVSWREDRAARGLAAPARGWVPVGAAGSFSWLDARLRYPRDEPADPSVESVVQRWSIPLTIDGASSTIEGTVTWVPRSVALAASGVDQPRGISWLWLASPLLLVVLAGSVASRRRRRRQRR